MAHALRVQRPQLNGVVDAAGSKEHASQVDVLVHAACENQRRSYRRAAPNSNTYKMQDVLPVALIAAKNGHARERPQVPEPHRLVSATADHEVVVRGVALEVIHWTSMTNQVL